MDVPPSAPPTFPPDQPLPGAPDPWIASAMPVPRSGPPYVMTEMIAAEPALSGRLLWRLTAGGASGPAARLAAMIGEAARQDEPIVTTGCGTSEHGAQAIALIVGDALRQGAGHGSGALGQSASSSRLESVQAFEAALDPQRGGLLLAVSHEGGSTATLDAMRAARANGALVALITVSARSPGGALADLVLETAEMDQSWCHTVAYLSAILVGAAAGAALSGQPTDTEAVRELLEAGLGQSKSATRIASRLADASHVLVLASGADRPAARELALKIEEATHLPATARDLETFLHGHLPATDAQTGLVLLLADLDRRPERFARARLALEAASVVGIRSAAIVGAGLAFSLPPELTPTGRLLVPDVQTLPRPVAALIGTATPLQLLTERLARARGANPDLLRRDVPAYRGAAGRAE